MEKRYQIFISSTYSDLKDERNKVMQTIMSLDCIPAGMELFPAMDEEQFGFIKRIIDDCDYYLLIVGARYGSMDENGVSYTEKEYDYAVAKGIPVMAFLHDDIASIPLKNADLDDCLRKNLDNFRKKVEKGRLVQYWGNADELNAKVAISLPKTIKMFPRTGWVKANLQTNAETLQEINQLQKELAELRSKNKQNDDDIISIENGLKNGIADLDAIVDVLITTKQYDSSIRRDVKKTWSVKLSIKDVFYKLGLFLIDEDLSDLQLRNKLSKISIEAAEKDPDLFSKCTIELKTFQKIKLHLKLLGLIETCTKQNYNSTFWRLSYRGRSMILNSLCILKDEQKITGSDSK